MRSANGWQQPLTRQLANAWPAALARDFPAAAMLSVELGLYLLARVLPGRPARDAWTLFGGYPLAEAAGHAASPGGRLRAGRGGAAGEPPCPALPVDDAPPPGLALPAGAVRPHPRGAARLPARRP